MKLPKAQTPICFGIMYPRNPDVGLKSYKSGMGGCGDAHSGTDFFHKPKALLIIGRKPIIGI
jgi:hypothetical protein